MAATGRPLRKPDVSITMHASDRAFIAFCKRARLDELRAAYADELSSADGEDWKMIAIERAVERIPT